MKKKRVVITGMGVVSCFGNDIETFYDQLLAGKSGISTITDFPCDDLSTKFGGVIRGFDSGEYIDKKQARRIDKCISYAMVSGKKALENAGLVSSSFENLDKKRCGIIIGTGMGGMSVFADGVITMKEKGSKRVTPFFIPYVISNMSSGLLGIDLGFMGPNYSVSTACATGNYAVLAALKHIQRGETDLVICGGTEAPIVPIGVAGFCACKALSQRNDAPEKASRPWDKDRDGFVMGEGAGTLVLESLEHAQARGAHIYAELVGGGITCDAYHMTEPRSDGEGVASCIRIALEDSGLLPSDINYINAHATSTPAGDMSEINALKKVFPNPSQIKINSTKSMIGHGLGAAAALEAIVVTQAIRRGMIHPTINLDNPEPDLGFDAPVKAEKLQIKAAISNSFGFGGHNAVIVITPFSE